MKSILITLVTLMGFIFPQDCEEPINVWFKISNDQSNKNYGQVISLDMSQGYSFCSGTVMYIIVSEIGSEDEIVVAFPNGGYWASPKPDPFLEELQEEFDSLERYLKNKGSSEWKSQ